jgi:alkylation response protein AidB-like acyl-CoA dehydrogenase
VTFGLSDEQQDLAGAVRSLLDKSDPGAAWPALAGQIGLAGLTIPERHGGSGAGLAELAVAAAEIGRRLLPCPLLGSTALATTAILASADPETCTRLLPALAAGDSVAALAWADAAGTWDAARPACRAAGGTLSGMAHYVLDGDTADVLLVAAHTGEGTALFEVDPADPGVHRRAVSTMDATRSMATVTLDGAGATRLGPGDATQALRRTLDAARVVLAAECAGAAQRALELTVEYTTHRVQFGRPLASFQALKHRMADCHVLVESARAMAFEAARADSTDAAVAKVYCGEALHRVAAEVVQLHGGIAITWEHDAHRYLNRAEASLHLFGSSSEILANALPEAG